MNYEDRWEKIKVDGKDNLGSGGQGTVYVVRNKKMFVNSFMKFKKSMELIMEHPSDEIQQERYQDLINVINEFTNEEKGYLGALKVLHEPKDATNYESAEERIKREIQAMKDASHPNLLDVLDIDDESKWFVSKYYSQGTLTKNRHLYTGDVAKTLRAIRPLVVGVAELHNEGRVHRDIKPDNIFLSDDGKLILGDFGLVFFVDDEHTRISDSFENVGSRDWMPGWSYSIKLEDISPTHDVFSLGKTIWAMISNTPIMPLWYFDRPAYNLENEFPNARFMGIVNELLSKCVVENEKDCQLENAQQLLEAIDEMIGIIDINADVIDPALRTCNVCGRGLYELRVDKDTKNLHDFKVRELPSQFWWAYVCNYCGHLQYFLREKGKPNPWQKR